MAETVVEGTESIVSNNPIATSNVSSGPRRRGTLANRNFRLLWFGENISLLGDQFYAVALPWLVLQLTGSALAVGTILAVAGIPRALLMLLGGVLTDRITPRILMLIANACRIVITGLLTLLVVTQTVQVWMLYVFSFTFGVVDAFFQPAAMAIVPTLVTEDQLASSNATLQGTALLVTAIGPGIGGIVVKIVGIAFSFFLDTISFVVTTCTLSMMKLPTEGQVKAKSTSIMDDIREAMVYVGQDELLKVLLIILIALNFLFIGPLLVGPAILAKVRFVEQGSLALGLLLSAMGAGSLVGMVGSTVLKPARLGIATLSTIVAAGLGIVIAGFSSSLWLTAALFAIIGASTGFCNLLIITWLQKRISREMMGRVMSVIMLSSMGLMPISSAVAGVVGDFNLTALFVLNGSLLVLTALLSLLNPTVRSMRATD